MAWTTGLAEFEGFGAELVPENSPKSTCYNVCNAECSGGLLGKSVFDVFWLSG